MTEKIHLEASIPEEYAGKRIDQALAALFTQFSRGQLQAWLLKGFVSVNNTQMKAKEKVKGGESVEINAELEAQGEWKAQAIDLQIVYEDDSLMVINKPAGLVVHPAAGNPDNTLLNALLYHHAEIANVPRAGIVHRLDKETSGLLVIAKTLSAHNHLVQALQAREIKREYQAIVHGTMTAGGDVNAPIGRDPKNRLKMAVTKKGKDALTHYRVLERFTDYTHIQLQLDTGRTHQIRVHMAHIHYPIVGDPAYGTRARFPKHASEKLITALQKFKRQALHASRLCLQHPETGVDYEWTCELPEDMQQLLKLLEQHEQRK